MQPWANSRAALDRLVLILVIAIVFRLTKDGRRIIQERQHRRWKKGLSCWRSRRRGRVVACTCIDDRSVIRAKAYDRRPASRSSTPAKCVPSTAADATSLSVAIPTLRSSSSPSNRHDFRREFFRSRSWSIDRHLDAISTACGSTIGTQAILKDPFAE